jgi:hypothetical protein
MGGYVAVIGSSSTTQRGTAGREPEGPSRTGRASPRGRPQAGDRPASDTRRRTIKRAPAVRGVSAVTTGGGMCARGDRDPGRARGHHQEDTGRSVAYLTDCAVLDGVAGLNVRVAEHGKDAADHESAGAARRRKSHPPSSRRPMFAAACGLGAMAGRGFSDGRLLPVGGNPSATRDDHGGRGPLRSGG